MIVDDEKNFRQMAAAMVRSMGCRVTICNDGRDALETYGKFGDEIDVVILDLVMPSMDGRTAFQQLKALNPNVQVILSSGYSAPSTGTPRPSSDRGRRTSFKSRSGCRI